MPKDPHTTEKSASVVKFAAFSELVTSLPDCLLLSVALLYQFMTANFFYRFWLPTLMGTIAIDIYFGNIAQWRVTLSETDVSTTPKSTVLVEMVKGYVFKISFPDADGSTLLTDEPAPLGNLSGPNPSMLLTAAVANCLSSSLMFCLGKSKIEVKNIRAEATPTIERNKDGYWRVTKINVVIHLQLGEGADNNRMQRCLGIFEKYCIVTGAVREGLAVNVQVAQDDKNSE